jgi:four helix bundle protein
MKFANFKAIMKTDNILQTKSYQFALDIIVLFKQLQKRKEFVLSKQLMRSGTAVGALVEEAIGGQSSKDFIHKMSIAYKEARETKYWLRLLRDSEYLTHDETEPYLNNAEELLRIIGSIQKTMKSRIIS